MASQRIGIYPGTFDPITHGHTDIIRRALSLVDILIIAVAMDTAKTPIFSLKERETMVKKEITSLLGSRSTFKRAPATHPTKTGKTTIEVYSFEGLLVNFAMEHQANLIIRGLRAVSDFEYEFQMAGMNARMTPEIQTVFLPASENTQFIASRFVKQIARLGGDITPFVPSHVAKKLKAYFS